MSNLKVIELILWWCKCYYCYSILLSVLPPYHLVLLFVFNMFFIFNIQPFCNLLLFSNIFGLIPPFCLMMFILSMYFILISCVASFKSWNHQAIALEFQFKINLKFFPSIVFSLMIFLILLHFMSLLWCFSFSFYMKVIFNSFSLPQVLK